MKPYICFIVVKFFEEKEHSEFNREPFSLIPSFLFTLSPFLFNLHSFLFPVHRYKVCRILYKARLDR